MRRVLHGEYKRPLARSTYVRSFAVAVSISLAMATSSAAAEPPGRPTVVTQRWLHAMHKQGWPLAALVDPTQGLVVLTRFIDSPSEDFKPVITAKRLCGDELAAQLPKLQKQLAAAMKQADTFSCHNKPGPPFCSYAFAFEYTSSTNLIMRADPTGTLALDAIAFLDGGSMNEAFYAKQYAWVAKQLRDARATSCTGDAQTAPAYDHVLDDG